MNKNFLAALLLVIPLAVTTGFCDTEVELGPSSSSQFPDKTILVEKLITKVLVDQAIKNEKAKEEAPGYFAGPAIMIGLLGFVAGGIILSDESFFSVYIKHPYLKAIRGSCKPEDFDTLSTAVKFRTMLKLLMVAVTTHGVIPLSCISVFWTPYLLVSWLFSRFKVTKDISKVRELLAKEVFELVKFKDVGSNVVGFRALVKKAHECKNSSDLISKGIIDEMLELVRSSIKIEKPEEQQLEKAT